MSLCDNRIISWTRRDALQALSCGFGLLAFAGWTARGSAVAGLIAAVSTALLVVPGILVGYPLLFLAIGTLYLHAKVRIGEPGGVPPATAASGA